MSLNYPNTVPVDNLRLPDALTVEHGPAALLSRFVLEADKVARAAGIYLRLRHDFDQLSALNAEQTRLGNWYPLIDTFNPKKSDVSAENAFWISGENERGEIVCTNAGRIYYWPDTNLEEQAVAMMYGRDEGQPVIITAEAAKSISGVVQAMGATWVRPDYRRRQLSHLLPRVGKAYGLSRWPVDWVIAYVTVAHVKNGLAFGYGARHFSHSVTYPGLHLGEMVLAYTSRDEVYEDLDGFLATELSDASGTKFAAAGVATFLAQEVMNTSPDGVRQGSSNRS